MKYKYIGGSIAARFQSLPLNCRPTSLQNKIRLSSSPMKYFVPSLKVMRSLVPSTAKRWIDCIFLWARTRRKVTQSNRLSIGREGLFDVSLSPGWTIVEASFRPKNLQRLWAEPTLSSRRADHVAVFLSVSHSDRADLKVCIYIYILLYHLFLYWPSQLQLRSKLKEIIRF